MFAECFNSVHWRAPTSRRDGLPQTRHWRALRSSKENKILSGWLLKRTGAPQRGEGALVLWKTAAQDCAVTWMQQVHPGLLKAMGMPYQGHQWAELPPAPLDIVACVESDAVQPSLLAAWLHPALLPGDCLAVLVCSWSNSGEIGQVFCFGDTTTKAKAEGVRVALLGARSLSSHGSAQSWGAALHDCLILTRCDF